MTHETLCSLYIILGYVHAIINSIIYNLVTAVRNLDVGLALSVQNLVFQQEEIKRYYRYYRQILQIYCPVYYT